MNLMCSNARFVIRIDELPLAHSYVCCIEPEAGVNRVRVVDFPNSSIF
jgi:hypothetical protein